MPFIYPSRIRTKLPVSRFKDIAENTDFLLQKKRRAFRRSAATQSYRIVTRHGNTFAVAYGTDYDAITNREWKYIVSDLPGIIPTRLAGEAQANSRERVKWLLAHFTQVQFKY